MKILNENSPLHFLPIEIGQRQLLLFDSLRFTLEMVDYNHIQLVKYLTKISKGQETKVHYKVFNYAWGLIDHIQRFYTIYKQLHPPKDSLIEKINCVYPFRNIIQHLATNIDSKLIKNSKPIYGTLKWVVSDDSNNETFNSILISGIYYENPLSFEPSKSSGYKRYINDIKIETETPDKKDDNEINISKLIEELQFIVNNLDSALNTQFKEKNMTLIDWKSRKDVVLNLKKSNVA